MLPNEKWRKLNYGEFICSDFLAQHRASASIQLGNLPGREPR